MTSRVSEPTLPLALTRVRLSSPKFLIAVLRARFGVMIRPRVWAVLGDWVSRHVSAQCLIGTLGVALLTLVCYPLHLNFSTVSFLYLIVVVLLSITGSFFSSALVSIIAIGCLDYFFIPPLFSLRVDDPLNVVTITVFLTTSLVITRLVSKLRKMAEDARLTVHRKLIEAEERDYTRIARELNEDINQRVALVAVGLDQLGELEHTPSESLAELNGYTRELRQRVSEISADLYAISQRLGASNLEYLGLETVAKAFCREFAARRKVEIDFRGRDVPGHVPLEISFALFRVLQEALLNSAKHSGERHFEVELYGTSGAIHLTVFDSGVGFDPGVAMQGSGLGLTSMRERLKLVNGEFSIDSQAQRGTKIHATAPLRSGSNARVSMPE
jgi:signal transduction histidine kinase